ncbi:kinase-like domain-containing protein [Aspergillus unguis]
MERVNQICNGFSSQLQKLRVRNHEERPFYPNGTARDVFRVDEERMNELFRTLLSPSDPTDRTISELVRWILRSASTTLAVILRIRPSGDSLILREFTDLVIPNQILLAHPKLTDEDLPISLSRAEALFPTLASEFFDTQFQFCAITLWKGGNFVYQDYRSQCPLPYKIQERIGGGAFGQVYKVKIERGHLRSRADHIGNLEAQWLARKDFRRQQSFTVELHALKEIMKKPQKHDNLVMVLAVLQYQDTNSLFFPLADCDLHQYLNGKYRGDQPAPVTLEEKSTIFRRGVALAGALAFLHGGLGGTVCLHLDLKPNNVLVYDAYHPDKEIWKITDFGLARVRDREYSSVAPEVQGIYLPPECGAPDGQVTTQSDVWSFGCIFSLIITYMVHGSRGVQKFTEKRGELPEGDFFYVTAKNSMSRVAPAVKAWFDHLKKSTFRDERESRLIRETLDYLLRNVLRPIRRQRALAKDVELSLKSIHDSCIYQASPCAPSRSQETSKHRSFSERLVVRLKHRMSEAPVARLKHFRYNFGTNGYGFRFSPLEGSARR